MSDDLPLRVGDVLVTQSETRLVTDANPLEYRVDDVWMTRDRVHQAIQQGRIGVERGVSA